VNWSIRSRIIDNQDIHHSVQEFFKIPFTNREIEVIKEIEKGGSNRDIGRRLCLSHHTIATHRKNIFRKSNCNSVLELMVYCRRLDIL